MEREQAASPTSGGVPTPDCGGGHRYTASPSHPSQTPVSRVSVSPVAGSRVLGFRGFLRASSAGFVDNPLRSRSPGGFNVPLPGSTARSPHRGPRGPGQGGGVLGGEASVRLQGPFTWWRGVGPGASTRAGTGLGQSARGHPTTAEQTVPLSLSQEGAEPHSNGRAPRPIAAAEWPGLVRLSKSSGISEIGAGSGSNGLAPFRGSLRWRERLGLAQGREGVVVSGLRSF